MTPILATNSLSKTFRDFWGRPRVRALRDLSLEVMPGEVFGILGPNGAGKSTLLKLLLGLLHPSSGSAEVLGKAPRDTMAKGRIGYLPEETFLYPYLTPVEVLDFYGCLFRLPRRVRAERTGQLLAMLGLEHAKDRPVGEFSKGMARRIGLAQALINNPALLILDEPTSGLDPIACSQIKELILSLARGGKTILLSSHLLADMEAVCSRVAILYDGALQAAGRLEDLLQVRDVVRLSFPEPAADALSDIKDCIARHAGALPAADHPARSLERFFLDTVGAARRGVAQPSGAAQGLPIAPFLETTPDTAAGSAGESA